MTYAEYLQSLGASADDIKVMDTAVGRKAFEKLQADAAAATAEVEKQKTINKAYEGRVNEWFDTHDKEFKTVESQLITANAKAAKAEAALRTAHERGMIDVAKDLGYEFDKPPVAPPNNNNGAPALDTSKYFTKEEIFSIAEKESQAIAIASDIAAEHVYLFGKPLRNMRELRAESVSRKVPLEQVWQEKYGVVKAREDKTAAETKAHEDALRTKITEEVRAELVSKFANPETRPLAESHSFLTPRPSTGREKQPWDAGIDGESGSNDRVRRATANAIKQAAGVH
jgi:hypothetical protein